LFGTGIKYRAAGAVVFGLPTGFKLSSKALTTSHLGYGVLLQPLNLSWLNVYHAIKLDPHFMDERDDLNSEEGAPYANRTEINHE